MFSPYYAWSGRRHPENHCAINVALYGPGRSRWAMTERTAASLVRSTKTFAVGPSQLAWTGSELVLDIDEREAPFGFPLRGRIRLVPDVVTDRQFLLDSNGLHAWWPIAPRARVEVDFDRPGLRYTGTGYLDMNAGDEPLEAGFRRWDWSRADLAEGSAVAYDLERRDGSEFTLALRFGRDGRVEERETPARRRLPRGPIWRLERGTIADPGDVRVIRTLEDSPFYARSLIDTQLFGERAHAMHESLDLDRFSRTWVRALLPFRMPRWPFASAPESPVRTDRT